MHRPLRAAARALALVTGLSSLGATCVPNPNERRPSDAGEPVGVGFAEIEGEMVARCNGASPACHGSAAANRLKMGADRMANYQLVMTFVDRANPGQSVLLEKALGRGTPAHGGGPVFASTSDPTYQKWLNWIQDGLIFDPTQKRVTYAEIEMDMGMSCLTASPACHGPTAMNRLKIGADPGANYQRVKDMLLNLTTPAESPLLKKALGQEMHGGGPVFTTEHPTYKKWLGWIAAGAPER